jgi:gliding motility-associated-like protein
MKTNCNRIFGNDILRLFFVLFSIASAMISFAQQPNPPNNQEVISAKAVNNFPSQLSQQKQAGLFGERQLYIQNIGQYGDTLEHYSRMGKIFYGYEGLEMPVLFTSRGLIHLQRKSSPPSYRAKRKMERKGMKEEEIEKTSVTVNRTISMEWVNANPNPQVIATDVTTAYHTYGFLKDKAKGYKKVTYKELYPGIDVEYSFIEAEKPGFEFRLLVKPGADISAVKMRYGGNVKSIETNSEGNLVIKSDIDGIIQSVPVCFFTDVVDTNEKTPAAYSIKKNTISFSLPNNYSKDRAYTIDPFVTATSSLVGSNVGIAKEIDFDYDGNIYVAGGGNTNTHQLAKFSPAGTLLWTFNGAITTPSWTFGGSYGGWVVEKPTGNIYLGQGLASIGFRVLRLNSAGAYDGYITSANSNFSENWKMIWSCNGGLPTMLIAGGGGSANNELAILAPPSVVPATSNLSGLTGGHNDISDIVIDPITNDMYTIYSKSVNTGGIDNIIFKHPPPYTSANIAWQVFSGYSVLKEPINRPYMQGLDNSSNTLAVNSHYLFYWDGVNLKAFNKVTGASVGTPLVFNSNTVLLQGGIFADECNNVFTGSSNGTIKVFKFNGTTFDDLGAADITITGFPANSVYDLVYDNAKELLYACGNGFVASFDISAYCPATLYKVSIAPDCINLSATASVSPVPPAGTTVTYVLVNGATQITSNSTGVFPGLTIGINYTVKAFLNRACGGTQAVTDFVITNPPTIVINDPATICTPLSVDLTAAAITNGSSAGLTFTYWMDAAATVPHLSPTATTAAGTYYIKGTAASTCFALAPVVVTTFPAPVAEAGSDQSLCFGENTQLNGSGGVSYSWSPTTFLDNPLIPNPRVLFPTAGSLIYNLTVTDLNGCKSQAMEQVTINVRPLAKVFAGNDTIIAFNQPLQLNGIDVNNSGFTSYTWTPDYGLNNPLIANPVANLDRDIVYTLKASTSEGCEGIDYISVKVYKGPEIYVPTGFTPDGDGLNDILKAIVVSIYNRWGQLVFTTSDYQKGWDGKIEGVQQNPAAFVWMAEGVDYKGNLVRRKGTTTIIR